MKNPTQTEELYDVVIYEKATRKIDAIIGKELKSWREFGGMLRVQTGQERINDHYECEMVAAGKYQKGDVLPTMKADDFAEMTILCPGFWMRFKATKERIDQIMKFILKEATESEIEFAENLKTKPPNDGDKV